MTKLDDREYVRGELPIEVDDASSTGKHASAGTRTMQRFWLAFSLVMVIALSFGIYKQVGKELIIQPNPDGSFPLFSGTWSLFPLILVLVSTILTGALVSIASSQKHVVSKSVAVALAVFFGTIFLAGNLNAHVEKAWNASMKSWVADTYELDYDYITSYHYAGVVGKPATKFSPAVYIDPPKNVRYLTTKEGRYVAELMPDVYGGDSVRVYEISNDPNPPLMEVKK